MLRIPHPSELPPSTADRFLMGITQVLAQAQERKRMQQEFEKEREILDLQKNKFELDKRNTDHMIKVADLAAKRQGFLDAENNAQDALTFMQGAPAPVGDMSQGVSGIQGLPQFDLSGALGRATGGGREDMSGAQPLGRLQEVMFPLINGGVLARRPQTDIELAAAKAKEAEQAIGLKAKEAYATEGARRQAAAEAPPTQDQIADNKRMAQAAEDARLQRIQANQIALMNAQSSGDLKRLTYELQKDRLELDRKKAEDARAEAARSNNPEAVKVVTEAVLNRNLDYNQLDRYQRANVDAMLGSLGMAIPRTLTGTEKTNQTKAESAYQSTEIVAEILKKNPEALVAAEIPGVNLLSPQARALKLHRDEMADVKTRLRTGAAVNKYEEDFYGRQIPTAKDLLAPGTVEMKLNHFRGLNLAETGRPVLLTSPDGKETEVITDGFNPNQRAVLRKKINMGWVPSPYQVVLPAGFGQAAPSANDDPLGILGKR